MPPTESAEIAISDVAAKVGRDRRTNSGRDAATKSATAAVTEVPTEVTSTPMRSVIGPDGVPLPLCRSALRIAIAKRAVGVAATHQVARRYSPRYSPRSASQPLAPSRHPASPLLALACPPSNRARMTRGGCGTVRGGWGTSA